jgi:hypothetical protein
MSEQPAPWVRVYVNDHRAGAAGGIALMRRCLRQNADTALGETLRALVSELEDDAAVLGRVAEQLAVRPDPVKPLVARLAEVAGRLKLNGRVLRPSPTSLLLELEALLAGIDAKRSLWNALEASGIAAPPGEDFAALAARAKDQRRRLRPHHHEAACVALARHDGSTDVRPQPSTS